jgi:peptidoglycan glycosyltransferase
MTTIDVRLQLRAARALERYIRDNRYSRGAVVVMDPASGNVLASVSYPWPSKDPAANVEDDAKAQPLLDRARYGLYPPGSTFKLVTAMAALRQDPSLAQTEFECRHLPDSRVGIQLPGWSRPIRDDELDKTPHGTVAMTEGLVVSCNAYFAQLGVRVGPQAIADTAAMFQIAAAEPATPAEVRKALPFASYGQGEVLASPLRMAVVAGAVAAGGVIPQPVWIEEQATAQVVKGQAAAGKAESKQAASKDAASKDASSKEAGANQVAVNPQLPAKAAVRVLDRRLAASLAGAMRQVVTSGTGRTLANAVMPVAGKTGTAQVDGAASHSWFIGFAPYDGGAGAGDANADSGTSKKIAFAVVVENAGYGARATPVVAEVVRAAKELGLAR